MLDFGEAALALLDFLALIAAVGRFEDADFILVLEAAFKVLLVLLFVFFVVLEEFFFALDVFFIAICFLLIDRRTRVQMFTKFTK